MSGPGRPDGDVGAVPGLAGVETFPVPLGEASRSRAVGGGRRGYSPGPATTPRGRGGQSQGQAGRSGALGRRSHRSFRAPPKTLRRCEVDRSWSQSSLPASGSHQAAVGYLPVAAERKSKSPVPLTAGPRWSPSGGMSARSPIRSGDRGCGACRTQADRCMAERASCPDAARPRPTQDEKFSGFSSSRPSSGIPATADRHSTTLPQVQL